MAHIELQHKKDVSSFRRVAIGTWATTYDPQVYGTMEVQVDRCLEYIKAFRRKTGRHLTMTHMMAKIMSVCLSEMPDANAILRFNRVYLRKRIGVFFQVAMKDPETGELDLSGTTVFGAEAKTLVEVMNEFEDKVRKVRKADDSALERTRSTFKRIPSMMLNFVLKAISFLSYTLNLDLRWAGLPEDPFGSVMVTNIGALGLDQAYAPLVPYSKVPLVLAVGAIREKPVVQDGEITVGKVMTLNATFDHRLLDGSHASIMARVVRDWIANPFERFDSIDDLPDVAAEPAQLVERGGADADEASAADANEGSGADAGEGSGADASEGGGADANEGGGADAGEGG